MKSILFSHSYFLRFDPKQWATGQPYAPIGTLYAAAVMREKDYAVSFFDTMFTHGPEDILPALRISAPDYFVLYDDGFNYLTKMCLTRKRFGGPLDQIRDAAKRLKSWGLTEAPEEVATRALAII
ncbi:MAG: hypothetical protein H7Y42_16055, partial [Chitinophagaceae bacterium]|nr:hypothetical protein [Chitinophagaceae bacterium]